MTANVISKYNSDDILTPEMIAANFHILPVPTTSMLKETKTAAKSSLVIL